jgi:hypothetical protein
MDTLPHEIIAHTLEYLSLDEKKWYIRFPLIKLGHYKLHKRNLTFFNGRAWSLCP